jgi:hypothetical protein
MAGVGARGAQWRRTGFSLPLLLLARPVFARRRPCILKRCLHDFCEPQHIICCSIMRRLRDHRVRQAVRSRPNPLPHPFGNHWRASPPRQNRASRHRSTQMDQSITIRSRPRTPFPCPARARRPACSPPPSTPVDKRWTTLKSSNFVQYRPTRKNAFQAAKCAPHLVPSS